MSLRESLDERVSKYMTTRFTQVISTDHVYRAARTMQQNGTTEAVVVDHEVPVGIITERDILYKVVAAELDPRRVEAKDIMSAPLEAIEDNAKVADAISKMSTLGIRRLGVTRQGKIVGLITQKAIVSGDVGHVSLPELAIPDSFACPYCNAVVKTRDELSKHIDRTHMGGAGLLEGDSTKW
jgi:CBS domain-containing protein